MTNNTRPIVSADWLMEHLHDSNVRIVDGSWHMPAAGRDARKEYHEQRIPQAIFFDIDELSAESPYPHMLPGADVFAQSVGAMGISSQHRIVVYDSLGIFSAARVWWMFRYFGAPDVLVLDGGLPAWKAAGGHTMDGKQSLGEQQLNSLPACDFNPKQPLQRAVNSNEVLQASRNGSSLILDARGAGRFSGDEQEPRAGLRSGHIPGSCNLPFTRLLHEGKMKSNAELKQIFDSLPLSTDKPVITSCGSGVTAAIISLALHCVGFADVALYDGSWSEWGSRDDLPVQQGL